MRTLFPGARLGNCLRHALNKLPKKLTAIAVPGPQGLALAVPHPVVPGAPAQGLAGVCAGPAVTPLCRPRRHHGWGGQWRARAALVSGQEGRLVCGARRPADAGDQHPAGSSPQRHRAETVRDEGVSSSQVGANRRFSQGWRTSTTWCPISVGPSMPASVAWKWKADEYRHATGSSICKSSPLEAFDER